MTGSVCSSAQTPHILCLKNKKMKIAFIVNVFPILTSETFILNQITGLIDRGCEVDIYAQAADSPSKLQPDVIKYNLLDRTFYYGSAIPKNKLIRVVKALGLIIRNFHKNPRAILKSLNIFSFEKEVVSLKRLYLIVPFMDRGPYDIIHCHFGYNGELGVLLRKLGVFNGKVVTTFHGFDMRAALEEGAGMYKRLFNEGDLFMPVSEYNHKLLIGFGLNKEKIVYHTMGIDLNKFRFKWQAENFGVKKTLKIITVARLVRVKALDNGIRAVHKVLKEHPGLDLEYNIVGDGYLTEELTALIHDLNLEKTVHLIGPNRKPRLMKS